MTWGNFKAGEKTTRFSGKKHHPEKTSSGKDNIRKRHHPEETIFGKNSDGQITENCRCYSCYPAFKFRGGHRQEFLQRMQALAQKLKRVSQITKFQKLKIKTSF